MKRLPVILLLMLCACASRDIHEEPVKKKELAFWQVLQYKMPGKKTLAHEDRWYRYDVAFDYVVKGEFDNTAKLSSACPIAKADYKVTEKKTEAVIREATYAQMPCYPCHRR